MRFDIFQSRADAHVRKAREYLQQANLARIEHQVAADHHAALAEMYKQRAAWLEEEISSSDTDCRPTQRPMPNLQSAEPTGRQAVLSWPTGRRLDNMQIPESA
ncbi:MAG TPA: hypothetical protein VE934_00785 [Polaromonas sp.]|uniref:hypothetical protein n=1 Tax=Polaromonas sp. TaxID=1869339 RepID=UPI002D5B5FEC|nr:hypothetical protein [Polaromonas sp.]HYW55468.1 hypothetical protein [Polaromonas sp.]